MATEADKVNTGALATLVVVSAFSLVGVTLAVTALARDQMSIEAAQKGGAAAVPYDELRRQQLQKLETGVPIEAAMQKVVQDLARDPNSATPGATPATPPAAPEGVTPTSADPGKLGLKETQPVPATATATGAPSEAGSAGATGALAPTPRPAKKRKSAAPAAQHGGSEPHAAGAAEPAPTPSDSDNAQ